MLYNIHNEQKRSCFSVKATKGENTVNKLLFHVFQDERFVDLNLYQYGWERTEPLHSYGPYRRNHYLFHYVISGKGVLYAEEHRYPVEAGQGFLILPGQTTTYCADEQDPWEYTWIEFDGLRVRESLTRAGLGAANPLHFSRAFKSVYGMSPRAYRQAHFIPAKRVQRASIGEGSGKG